jgi:hypothetical protein
MVTLRYHGNYVGPGWSAGRYQNSVANSDVPAIDEFDETAKEHDAAYYYGKNLTQADYKFFRKNWGRGFKRSAAALAVGIQGTFRGDDSSSSNATQMKRKTPVTPPYSGRKRPATLRAQSRARRSRTLAYAVVPPKRKTTSKRSTTMRNKLRTKRRSYGRKRSGGMRSSISGGYFGKGTSKKDILSYFAQRGVVFAREFGNNFTSDATNKQQSVLIGHSTYCKRSISDLIAYSMTKMLAVKLGCTINSFSEFIGGTTIRMTLYIRNTNTGAIVPLSSGVLASSTTWNQLKDVFISWLNAVTTDSIIWNQLVYETKDTADTQWFTNLRLDLLRCRLQLYSKSSLKIQNKSKESSNDADAVDRVPLYGKSYEGSGNYWMYKPDNLNTTPGNYLMFNTDENYQYIFNDFGAGSAGSSLREPPIKELFVRVKASGKAHLDPGMIKTSVLNARNSMSLNALLKVIQQYSSTNNQISLGKFRFFIMEKMIQSAVTTTQFITVAYEHDFKLGCVATCSKASSTNYILEQTPQ